ncbi:ribonuclease M5 [Alicyclobacillus contaminans]|uniref:toprim domain-containing protein n=1 Tax=Alicyclobacillus contaminans TaxID=392016 RepID=UPI0004001B94|nr:DUF4093 domain-containing protein [Alicyclobacillus contaminans]GMA50551.1 ribonuclease M5 [Alicyclobacillus contaminans]
MKIQEIIVVEGIHDKQAVQRVVEADIWVVGGDRVAERFLRELERASRTRGVLVLTDPDGPGERIRRRIAARVPHCKHAFLPRKLAASPHGLGVEHASGEAIVEALRRARPTPPKADGGGEFTMDDLRVNRLAGGADSAARRAAVGEQLGIGYGNAKAFLHKLNALGVARWEWDAALKTVERDQVDD